MNSKILTSWKFSSLLWCLSTGNAIAVILWGKREHTIISTQLNLRVRSSVAEFVMPQHFDIALMIERENKRTQSKSHMLPAWCWPKHDLCAWTSHIQSSKSREAWPTSSFLMRSGKIVTDSKRNLWGWASISYHSWKIVSCTYTAPVGGATVVILWCI